VAEFKNLRGNYMLTFKNLCSAKLAEKSDQEEFDVPEGLDVPRGLDVPEELVIHEGLDAHHEEFVDRVCRKPEVRRLTGLSDSTIYEEMAKGRFPKNFKLTPGGRASGWLLSDVLAYLAQRSAERDIAA